MSSLSIGREQLHVSTSGRSTVDLTHDLQRCIARGDVTTGIATVFVHHTSASLFINENADPDVRGDLERWMTRLVQDGDPIFAHTDEGPDDMSAHIRAVLTATTLSIPIEEGRLDLGRWQGVYLWEHRTPPHTRRVSCSWVGH